MEKAKAETKAEIIVACRSDFVDAFTTLIPTVVTWVQQNPNAPPSNFPMPSFTGSNSMNTAPYPYLVWQPHPHLLQHLLLHPHLLQHLLLHPALTAALALSLA